MNLIMSQGHQKQRRLPCVDPLLPGHVLVLSSFPGLVRQLTVSKLQATGRGIHPALALFGLPPEVMNLLRLHVVVAVHNGLGGEKDTSMGQGVIVPLIIMILSE